MKKVLLLIVLGVIGLTSGCKCGKPADDVAPEETLEAPESMEGEASGENFVDEGQSMTEEMPPEDVPMDEAPSDDMPQEEMHDSTDEESGSVE